jgi:hypothetical protein
MNARKIVTTYNPPPIPWRGWDYCAHREGDTGEDPCGWGATEREAISDLRDREAEAQDEAEARAARKAGAA